MNRDSILSLAPKFAVILVTLLFSISCSTIMGARTELEEPTSQVAEQQPVVEKQAVEIAEPVEEAQLQDDAVKAYVASVMDEVNLLRADGERLAEEGAYEESRKAYDDSLNVILSSGIALDAYPELSTIFKSTTRDLIIIEDELAKADAKVEVSTLRDDLESIEDTDADVEEVEAEPVPETVSYDLPIVHNARVQYFIERFQGKRRKVLEDGIRRSGRFIEAFRQIMREEGVPEDLVYLAMIESTYKVNAYSRARAKGIWQFMSWTGKQYGLRVDYWIDERSNPYKAARSAARYLHDLNEDLGDWLLAIAAYNGGPGRVGRGVKKLGTKDFWKLSSSSRYLRKETRNFVPSIFAAAIIMKNREKYGFDHIVEDDPWEFETVQISSPIDLRIAAEQIGLSVDRIRELNPALRQMITPQNYSKLELRVPVGYGNKLQTKLASLPKADRLKYTTHKVRKGQTLSGIATSYKVSVSTITNANNIRNARKISIGQNLIIPLSAGYQPTSYSKVSAKKGAKLTHVVRRGEALSTIAKRYGTSVNSIASWNSLNSRNLIHPGDRLVVYAYTVKSGSSSRKTASTSSTSGNKVTYKVKSGDTLYGIAIKYKTSVNNLKRWNNLSRSTIRPGDKITVYVNPANIN
jgi:membrane-bound lytic murein transglycosylase D